MNTKGEWSVVVRSTPPWLPLTTASARRRAGPPALAPLRGARPPGPPPLRRSACSGLLRYARACKSGFAGLRARPSLRRASPPPPSGVASARSAPRALSLPLRPLAGARRPRAPRSRPGRGCASASRSAPWRTPHLPGLRASLLRAGGAHSGRAGRAPRAFPRSARPGPRRKYSVSGSPHLFGTPWRGSAAQADKASLSLWASAPPPPGIHASR